MTHLFISHSKQDKALALSLAERLKDKGYHVFLDFSSQFGIEGGVEWEHAIWNAIRRSAAVLLCSTPDITASQWAFAEVMIARYEGKRVFPLLFKGGVDCIWEILRTTTQIIDFSNEPELGYKRLFETLERGGYTATVEQRLYKDRSPYAGLRPLQTEDAPTFFARRQDAENIINLLQPRPGGYRLRTLTIIGPSGSGKSSLARAGILPKLISGVVQGSENWIYSVVSPGNKPFFRLAEAIKRSAPQLESVRTIENEMLADEKGLSYIITDALVLKPEGSFFLLIIDQLEELLTRAGEEITARFLDTLAAAVSIENDGDGRLIIVATLRADFYATFLTMRQASQLLKNVYPLSPLTVNALREVIDGPARIGGITFEDGLVQRILDDAGTSDALPLLSFVLRSMYDGMSLSQRLFTHSAYERLGGLQGALGNHAEKTFGELSQSTGTALISTILQHFVVISPDGKAARRRVRRDEIDPQAMQGVDKFVEGRLFIAGEDEEGHPTIEVAHEAIFRNWTRLANTIANEAATAQYLRQVLNQGVSDRLRLGVLLGSEQRKLLNKHRENIKLESAQLELAIRSAIQANDEALYWFKRGSGETTKIWTIAKDILVNADPISRYRLLELLDNFLIVGSTNEAPRELTTLALDSEYPALVRYASRILARYGKNVPIFASQPFLPTEFVRIPEGECLIGLGERHKSIFIESFEISKYPITNLEYAEFVKAMGHRKPSHWRDSLESISKADHPVVYVSWFDTVAYCHWLSSVSDRMFRLPTELEWEKAAGWNPHLGQKTLYPWGNLFENSRCNTRESQIGDTTPIGQYSPHGGDSLYGVSDLAGNVWEWTSTRGQDAEGKYFEYPSTNSNDLREATNVWGPRVQKGGTFLAGEEFARVNFRLINLPELVLQDFGFRVVRQIN